VTAHHIFPFSFPLTFLISAMLSPNDTTENTDGRGEAPEVNSLNSSDLSEQLNYLHSYPFVSDLEFKTGLAVILGHPGTAASDAEVLQQDDLILQAKCFYISRFAHSPKD
jgi:hypothetical protein